jgi:hypothetical protein
VRGKIIMKLTTTNLQKWLYLISGIILLAGLGSAVLIYASSLERSASVLGYEEGGGSVYPIQPDDSKQYLRGLELYGGTANVLADELRRWFAGLWRGKSLAFMVACIAILVSWVLFRAARRLPSRENANVQRRG